MPFPSKLVLDSLLYCDISFMDVCIVIPPLFVRLLLLGGGEGVSSSVSFLPHLSVIRTRMQHTQSFGDAINSHIGRSKASYSCFVENTAAFPSSFGCVIRTSKMFPPFLPIQAYDSGLSRPRMLPLSNVAAVNIFLILMNRNGELRVTMVSFFFSPFNFLPPYARCNPFPCIFLL